jgi:hypothetical protein
MPCCLLVRFAHFIVVSVDRSFPAFEIALGRDADVVVSRRPDRENQQGHSRKEVEGKARSMELMTFPF